MGCMAALEAEKYLAERKAPNASSGAKALEPAA
jgi:hypothetical protein